MPKEPPRSYASPFLSHHQLNNTSTLDQVYDQDHHSSGTPSNFSQPNSHLHQRPQLGSFISNSTLSNVESLSPQLQLQRRQTPMTGSNTASIATQSAYPTTPHANVSTPMTPSSSDVPLSSSQLSGGSDLTNRPHGVSTQFYQDMFESPSGGPGPAQHRSHTQSHTHNAPIKSCASLSRGVVRPVTHTDAYVYTQSSHTHKVDWLPSLTLATTGFPTPLLKTVLLCLAQGSVVKTPRSTPPTTGDTRGQGPLGQHTTTHTQSLVQTQVKDNANDGTGRCHLMLDMTDVEVCYDYAQYEQYTDYLLFQRLYHAHTHTEGNQDPRQSGVSLNNGPTTPSDPALHSLPLSFLRARQHACLSSLAAYNIGVEHHGMTRKALTNVVGSMASSIQYQQKVGQSATRGAEHTQVPTFQRFNHALLPPYYLPASHPSAHCYPHFPLSAAPHTHFMTAFWNQCIWTHHAHMKIPKLLTFEGIQSSMSSMEDHLRRQYALNVKTSNEQTRTHGGGQRHTKSVLAGGIGGVSDRVFHSHCFTHTLPPPMLSHTDVVPVTVPTTDSSVERRVLDDLGVDVGMRQTLTGGHSYSVLHSLSQDHAVDTHSVVEGVSLCLPAETDYRHLVPCSADVAVDSLRRYLHPAMLHRNAGALMKQHAGLDEDNSASGSVEVGQVMNPTFLPLYAPLPAIPTPLLDTLKLRGVDSLPFVPLQHPCLCGMDQCQCSQHTQHTQHPTSISYLSIKRINMNMVAHSLRSVLGLSVCVLMCSSSVAPPHLVSHSPFADHYPNLPNAGASFFTHFMHRTTTGDEGSQSFTASPPTSLHQPGIPLHHNILILHDVHALPILTQRALTQFVQDGSVLINGVEYSKPTPFLIIGLTDNHDEALTHTHTLNHDERGRHDKWVAVPQVDVNSRVVSVDSTQMKATTLRHFYDHHFQYTDTNAQYLSVNATSLHTPMVHVKRVGAGVTRISDLRTSLDAGFSHLFMMNVKPPPALFTLLDKFCLEQERFFNPHVYVPVCFNVQHLSTKQQSLDAFMCRTQQHNNQPPQPTRSTDVCEYVNLVDYLCVDHLTHINNYNANRAREENAKHSAQHSSFSSAVHADVCDLLLSNKTLCRSLFLFRIRNNAVRRNTLASDRVTIPVEQLLASALNTPTLDMSFVVRKVSQVPPLLPDITALVQRASRGVFMSHRVRQYGADVLMRVHNDSHVAHLPVSVLLRTIPSILQTVALLSGSIYVNAEHLRACLTEIVAHAVVLNVDAQSFQRKYSHNKTHTLNTRKPGMGPMRGGEVQDGIDMLFTTATPLLLSDIDTHDPPQEVNIANLAASALRQAVGQLGVADGPPKHTLKRGEEDVNPYEDLMKTLKFSTHTHTQNPTTHLFSSQPSTLTSINYNTTAFGGHTPINMSAETPSVGRLLTLGDLTKHVNADETLPHLSSVNHAMNHGFSFIDDNTDSDSDSDGDNDDGDEESITTTRKDSVNSQSMPLVSLDTNMTYLSIADVMNMDNLSAIDMILHQYNSNIIKDSLLTCSKSAHLETQDISNDLELSTPSNQHLRKLYYVQGLNSIKSGEELENPFSFLQTKQFQNILLNTCRILVDHAILHVLRTPDM